MMEITSPLDSPNSPKGMDAFSVDPALIVEYLAKVLEVTLGATRQELEKDGSLLSSDARPHTIQRCTRFALENQVALYVTKEIASAEAVEGVSDSLSKSLLAHYQKQC